MSNIYVEDVFGEHNKGYTVNKKNSHTETRERAQTLSNEPAAAAVFQLDKKGGRDDDDDPISVRACERVCVCVNNEIKKSCARRVLIRRFRVERTRVAQ